MDMAGCVLSLGLLPVIIFFSARSTPKSLTNDAMILSNGKSIRWNEFTSARITNVNFKGSSSSKGTYLGTRYELKYPNGSVKFGTQRLENGVEVVNFINQHLPPQIVK
jgi:hypothetical protein